MRMRTNVTKTIAYNGRTIVETERNGNFLLTATVCRYEQQSNSGTNNYVRCTETHY